MKRELLEVGEMDFATVHRIQIRALRSLQRSLYNRVRNTETLRKRPVAPSLIVGKQPAEDIDVGPGAFARRPGASYSRLRRERRWTGDPAQGLGSSLTPTSCCPRRCPSDNLALFE